LYAKFEIRQHNLEAARKSLGMAIGMCPKDRLFKGYIELELEVMQLLFAIVIVCKANLHANFGTCIIDESY